MKQTKLFIAALLAGAAMMLTPQKAWADSVTDDQLTSAVSSITAGSAYYVFTYYTDASTKGSTKYYLTAGGSLTTSKTDAVAFNFVATTQDKFVTAGNAFMLEYHFAYFTNADKKVDSHIRINGRSFQDYEAQVFYKNNDNLYAVRSTNAASGEWWENAWWTVSSAGKACYTQPADNNAVFLWELEAVDVNARFSDAITQLDALAAKWEQVKISTVINGTKYYLTNTGTLTTTFDQTTCTSHLVKLTLSDDNRFADNSYKVFHANGYLFSNANSATQTYIEWNANDNANLYRSQVFYYDSETGKYAVRGSNVNAANYQGYYWSVKDGTPYYSPYADYIWTIESAFDYSQVYLIETRQTGGNYRYAAINPTNNGQMYHDLKANASLYKFSTEGGNVYIKDLVANKWVNASDWTLSDSKNAVVVALKGWNHTSLEETKGFVYTFYPTTGEGGLYMNAYGGTSKASDMGKYSDNEGSQWFIMPVSDFDVTGRSCYGTGLINAAASNGITLSYTGSVTNYGTLILPFAYTLPSGVDAYSELSVSGEAIMGEKIASGSQVAANTPVLLKGTGTFDVSGAAATVEETYTSGILTGIYANYTTIAGDYVLQNQSGSYAFYKVNGTTPTIKPFRAYMPASVGGAAKAFTFNFDGDATAINEIVNSKLVNGKCYNLAGQRVSNPSRGIYVIGGRKVIVK